MDPYSLSVIASDPKSGVRSLRKTVTLILPNNSIEEEGEDEPSLKESLLNLLHENLNKFWPDIGGILLGFGHIKFSQLKLEWMRDKVAVKLKGKFYVFHPVVGAEMQCTVASRDNEKVTCKILNQFIIDVYSPDSCWNHVVKNEVVSVKIELISQLPGDDVPKMFGKILFNSSSKEFIENVENVDLLTEDEDLEDFEAVMDEVCQTSTTQSSIINVKSTSVPPNKRKISSASENPPKDGKKERKRSILQKILPKPLDFSSNSSTSGRYNKVNEAPEGFKVFPKTNKMKLKLMAPNGKSFQTYKAAWEWVEKNPSYLHEEKEPQTPEEVVDHSEKHVKDDEIQGPEKKGNEIKSPLKKVAEPKIPQKTVSDPIISKKVEKEITTKASNQETKDQKLPDSDADMFDCHSQQAQQKDAEMPKDPTSSASKKEDLDSDDDTDSESEVFESPDFSQSDSSSETIKRTMKVSDKDCSSDSEEEERNAKESKTNTSNSKTPKKNAEPLANKKSPIVNWIDKNKKKDHHASVDEEAKSKDGKKEEGAILKWFCQQHQVRFRVRSELRDHMRNNGCNTTSKQTK